MSFNIVRQKTVATLPQNLVELGRGASVFLDETADCCEDDVLFVLQPVEPVVQPSVHVINLFAITLDTVVDRLQRGICVVL